MPPTFGHDPTSFACFRGQEGQSAAAFVFLQGFDAEQPAPVLNLERGRTAFDARIVAS